MGMGLCAIVGIQPCACAPANAPVASWLLEISLGVGANQSCHRLSPAVTGCHRCHRLSPAVTGCHRCHQLSPAVAVADGCCWGRRGGTRRAGGRGVEGRVGGGSWLGVCGGPRHRRRLGGCHRCLSPAAGLPLQLPASGDGLPYPRVSRNSFKDLGRGPFLEISRKIWGGVVRASRNSDFRKISRFDPEIAWNLGLWIVWSVRLLI